MLRQLPLPACVECVCVASKHAAGGKCDAQATQVAGCNAGDNWCVVWVSQLLQGLDAGWRVRRAVQEHTADSSMSWIGVVRGRGRVEAGVAARMCHR